MGILLLLLYMVLLGFRMMITPGIGFFGKLILLLPQWMTESSHVPAYGLLTWLMATGFLWRGWPIRYALSAAMAGAMVFGVWMEVVQGSIPGRTTSADDVLLNGVGIGLAALVMLWHAAHQVKHDESLSNQPYVLTS